MFYTYVFNNTKANSFLFINTKLTTLLIRYYSAYFKPFFCIIAVISYNS